MADYQDTMVLPQADVDAATDPNSDIERKRIAVSMELYYQKARLSSMDNSIGRLVDRQIAQGRQIDHLTAVLSQLEQEYFALLDRLKIYVAVGLGAAGILLWLR